MKTRSAASLVLVLALAGLAGCSTPASRIRGHQAAFDTWSPDVQATVRSGKVDLGFTEEQVRVALGDPERVFTRKSAAGTEEVWAYYDTGPKFSVGVGLSSGGYGSGAAGGVAYTQREDTFDDADRVVFRDGKVVAVEMRRR